MAILAIKGHQNRGKEVIEILEMLGGKTSYECSYKDGFDSSYFFFINTDEKCYIDGLKYNSEELKNYYIFTLEEFLEKYPYKVGDKVLIDNEICTITRAIWDISRVLYKVNNNDYDIFVVEQLYPIKKKQTYPKTYAECYDILRFKNRNKTEQQFLNSCDLYDAGLMTKLSMLKLCRDAYWKIYGEEMGLGKSWEPEDLRYVYSFFRLDSDIIMSNTCYGNNHIFEFPTEEMCNTFYENFKDIIKQCKELL